jgi:GntR family transcriptional regulator, rspAB operon transcriptional repressor
MLTVCSKHTIDRIARFVNNAIFALSYRGDVLAKRATQGKAQRRVLASVSPLVSPASATAAAASTLSEKVYRAFKRDIIHSVYQPGEPLSEKELADRYKGSRTPVREAAVRLQNERLLRIVPNRGYFVAQITLQVLNDIYEFRCAVECAAAELAARKGADAESLRKLNELAQVTCSPDDRESCVRFIESDTAFHMIIARLSRNQMLIQAISEARSQMERIMFAAIDINYYGEAPGREHRAILKAIEERDPEAARREMYEHIIQSKDKVLGLTGFASRRS